MSDDKKYRLVTRADFDGVVAGGLLVELGLIDDVEFAEPKAMQDGLVKITGNDITTNLPYVEGVHLCFDHHISETERVGARDNHIISADAPSAARVVGYFSRDDAGRNSDTLQVCGLSPARCSCNQSM